MSKTLLLVVAAALIVLPAADALRVREEQCGSYPTCTICVAHPYCGWCSEDVVYPNGTTGPQCAAVNTNGSTPFTCNGIFSTEQCVAGYTCNVSTFQCQLAAPGQGVTKLECEANCTNNGQVYLCNHTSKQCYEVPAGTPGASSYAVCEAECIHPSSAPSSSTPSSQAPTQLYACNYTSGDCEPAEPGKGSSKQVCEQECTKSNGTEYICNTFLHKCEKAGPGVPGLSKAACDKICLPPKPTPGPPSNFPLGLYRGVEVSNGYKLGEVDLDVNKTDVIIVYMYANETMEVVYGKPYHIPDDKSVDLIILLTSGPDSGKMIQTLSVADVTPGPETTFVAIAFGTPGGAAPQTISSAWSTTGESVFAMSLCQSSAPLCHFYLPPGVGGHGHFKSAIEMSEVQQRPILNDPCSEYGQSCTVCIAHEDCGWCSTNVTYQDGTEGTQCAGFNPNGTGDPFVCNGQFSTVQCVVGYVCDTTNYQCKQAAPGNGLPKEQCETLCRPTPPPTPPPQMYQCNTTLRQCFKCNSTSCPGGLPQGPCEAGCVHPKHGPHAALIGIWRGIYIQAGYKNIEAEYQFDNTSLHVFHNGDYKFTANITSFGADAMLMDIMDGQHTGFTFGAIYQFSNVVNQYEMVTYARGQLGASFPDSYSQAMATPGMEVLVLAKCLSPPCNFAELPVP